MRIVTVSRLDVLQGVTPSPLLPTENGCPCCGAAVRAFELELEVSGLPVSAMDQCTSCHWSQGWDHEGLWAVQAQA